jgi:hypothetical protein
MKIFKPVSLKFQFTLFFVFFLFAIYATFIITAWQQFMILTETVSLELGIPVAEAAAKRIDGDAFEALAKSLDPQDPYYKKGCGDLWELKQTVSCIYLYTMAPDRGTVYRFILDGSGEMDDLELFSPLGTEEDAKDYYKPIKAAMETKQAQSSTMDYSPEWGWTVSAFAPILNSRGEAVGITGCDFSADRMHTQFRLRMIRQLVLSGIFTAAGFVIYFYMINGVNRQNRRLIELREKAEAASTELKEERDTIAAMKDALKVGLFFMDKNFVIQDHYSRALEDLLEMPDLGGKKFTDLLSASVKEQKLKNLIEYFVLLFNRARLSNMSPAMLENLNPIQELNYSVPGSGREKILQCTFVPVDRGNGRLFILGNLQDMTTEKQLRKQLNDETLQNREEIAALRSRIKDLEETETRRP